MTSGSAAKTHREKAAMIRAAAEKQQKRRRNMTIVIALVSVVVVIGGCVVLFMTLARNADAQRAAAEAPPANVTTDNAYLAGKTGSKVTLDVYEDFQCPACKSLEDQFGGQFDTWLKDGKVAVKYHPVAILDRMSSGTNYSTRAMNAAGAVIATKPDAFPAFHKLLFDNQPAEGGTGLTDDKLIELAGQAGADKAAVTPLITSGKYAGWVAATTDKFTQVYNSTPTVVINGKKWDPKATPDLKAEVEKALAG